MKAVNPPPFFSTGDPGSFAQRTLRVRKPAIIDKILDVNEFSDEQRQAMLALKEELLHGSIGNPFLDPSYNFNALDSESVQMWEGVMPAYTGKSWLDIPFYFAESFLYLRILLAIGYFDPRSSFFMRDPYRPFKMNELFSEKGGLAIGRVLLQMIQNMADPAARLREILYNSLWGNRVDLSLFSIAEKSRERVLSERSDNLLIDHSQKLVRLIDRAGRVDFILDNTGQELVSDLIAVWHMLTNSPDRTVVIHAKRYPFYVSDAMVGDTDETISALARDHSSLLKQVGEKIISFRDQERLQIRDHYFWNGPLHYTELPPDLNRELSNSDVVVLKGDINYRRTVSDRKWDVFENLETIASYFPADFALLRTMKSESVVDIDEERAAGLAAKDPEWKVNGERGIIRVVEKTRH